MGRIGKTFALFLTLTILISCLVLLTVKPANAQTIPKPSVPEFTVQLVETSQMQPIFWGHPFNTWNISVQPDNESAYIIELIVKNQPFTPFKENISEREWEICLWYNVRIQIGNSSNWITVYSPANTGPFPTNADYTVIPFSIQPSQLSNDSKTPKDGFYIRAYHANNFDYSPVTDWIPAGQVQVSFQVEALIGYVNMVIDKFTYPKQWVWVFRGQTSDWSNTQTITIPASSTIPSPSPTVPELPWLVIVPLLVATLFIAMKLRHRKNTPT